MDKKSYDSVRETITIIEAAIERREAAPTQLNIQGLADMSFLSKNQYQRLFHSITDESVMEYIKKRKLDIARRALCETDASILDIALNHGYLSHEGFTRAFKAYFGMSPVMYRKNYKLINEDFFKEDLTMKTNSTEISVQRLIQNADAAAKTVDMFITEANNFSIFAERLANEEGRNAASIHVLIRELHHLISKAAQTRDLAKLFAKEQLSLFERADKIYGIIKALEDMKLQMNILALNSGIEVARMGKKHREQFNQVQKGFSDLAISIAGDKDSGFNFMGDLVEIISEDIKTNVYELINNIIDIINHAAEEGKEAARFTEKTAMEMGEYGRGFASISNEINHQIEELLSIGKKIGSYDVKAEFFGSNMDYSIQSLRKLINRVSEIAFLMNIIAFDTEIEAARAGGFGNTEACVERILKYAGRLQEVQSVCAERFEEAVKLPELYNKVRSVKYDAKLDVFVHAKSVLSDVFFQGRMNAIQLRMEAERANRNVFKDIAKLAEESLKTISDIDFSSDVSDYKTALEKYYAQTVTIRDRCRDDGEAQGDHGCCFRFMAGEYEDLAARIEALITELMVRNVGMYINTQ